MNSHTYFNERKEHLLLEYVSENKKALRGRRIIFYSLWAILLLKLALALFEIPVFIILHKPVHILSILLILPLLLVLYIIHKGAKGFTYVLLISSTLRLIIYFVAVYKTLPDTALTNAYTFILFGVLLMQFFISLLLLISFDCDTYFTAVQRINIKVHGEELLSKKNNNTEKRSA